MKHDKAVERVRDVMDEYHEWFTQWCREHSKQTPYTDDAYKAGREATSTDCTLYADALVRLAEAKPCELLDGLRILECAVCHRKTPLNYHNIIHAPDCSVGIGLAIIEERKGHEPPASD